MARREEGSAAAGRTKQNVARIKERWVLHSSWNCLTMISVRPVSQPVSFSPFSPPQCMGTLLFPAILFGIVGRKNQIYRSTWWMSVWQWTWSGIRKTNNRINSKRRHFGCESEWRIKAQTRVKHKGSNRTDNKTTLFTGWRATMRHD